MENKYMLNRNDKEKIDVLNGLDKDLFIQRILGIVFNTSSYEELSNWGRLIAIRQSELWPDTKPNDAPTTEQWAKLSYVYRDLTKSCQILTHLVGPITQAKISSLL